MVEVVIAGLSQFADNTNGGSPLQPCDTIDNTFVCSTGFNTDCSGEKNTFVLGDANAIVLRAAQVAALQGGASEIVTLSPTTELKVAKDIDHDGSNARPETVTVTAHANSAINAGDGSVTAAFYTNHAIYTASAMAGVGVGVGLPLLLALVGAIVIIFKQRKCMAQPKSCKSTAQDDYVHHMDTADSPTDTVQRSATTYYQPVSPDTVLGHSWEAGTVVSPDEMDGGAPRHELGCGKAM